MKRLGTFLIAGILSLAMSGVAFAQYPPEEGPTATVSDTVVTPGEPVTISGSGWLPGSTVSFTFFSDPVSLGSATVQGDGTFTAQVTIPEDASPGQHVIEVSGTGEGGNPRTVEIFLTVAGQVAQGPPAAAPGGLPFTGFDFTVWMALALALVAIGAGLVVVSRRRSRAR